MPTKTICLELDAYQKLRRAKRFPRDSFSEVVRHVHVPENGVTGRELLAREVLMDESDFEAIDALNANDAATGYP